ncbi:hypothetical protein [Streptomyces sp. NPDC020681]|uniref:hypothetical protein n=1 Tax=Streptomyces sp. NPDC020681 TaxID=3365083 RepID=UPI00378F04AC
MGRQLERQAHHLVVGPPAKGIGWWSATVTLSMVASTVKTSFLPPWCQNLRSASKLPVAVTVTFRGRG